MYNNDVLFSFWSVLRLLLGGDNNEVVCYFWSVPRLLPGNNEFLFSFWSVPMLLAKGEKDRCYLLSEIPHESRTILDKSTPFAKG
jgi:hypothetical protein